MRSQNRKYEPETSTVKPAPVNTSAAGAARRAWLLVLLVVALLGAACSSSGSSGGDASPAVAAAEANQGSLTNTGDLRTIEVLNVADGSATTLQDAVTGDRPVLLWFYAPH